MMRWLFSRTVREAVAMRKHVHRWYSAQRDLLSPQAAGAVTLAMNELQAALSEPELNAGRVRIKMEELDFAANKWLKPYPDAVWRENVEVLLVAIAVAMGIRTFFIQPFKIPTGSMQPTLYGVMSVPDYTRVVGEVGYLDHNKILMDETKASQYQKDIEAGYAKELKKQKDLRIPGAWARIVQWFHGVSYVQFTAPTDGSVEAVSRPWPAALFSIYQHIEFAGVWHTIWFPPDYGESPLEVRAGLLPGKVYRKGEDVVKIEVHAGDHLFVDRLTYNFREPRRGEIVVFETKGINEDSREKYRIPANEFYIKRLVGLGGETISLKQDYEVTDVPQPAGGVDTEPVGHLVVNGQPLSAATPHFENLYSFSNPAPGQKTLHYQSQHYYGHALIGELSPGESVEIPPNHYFVMGDNTFNSLDSRYWDSFPAQYVIGKSFFVYWPISKRFGLGNQ